MTREQVRDRRHRPTWTTPGVIFAVDLHGTALVLEEFGNVIARGGSGVVIAS
jgi:hypothetical protein